MVYFLYGKVKITIHDQLYHEGALNKSRDGYNISAACRTQKRALCNAGIGGKGRGRAEPGGNSRGAKSLETGP